MTDEIKLQIVLETGETVKGFLSLEKQAEKSAKNIKNDFDKATEALDDIAPNLSGTFTDVSKSFSRLLTNPFTALAAGAVGAGLAVKQAFDLSLEGDKLKRVETQFASLTDQFGIAGQALKDSFNNSLGGLVDDSDALESLNRGILTLGQRASQLPQIMDIARKATTLFGGEVTSNFEAINQAIATGATRQLRGLGIIIDSEKAYKDYAKSIGVAVDVLSEAGKQQAILDAVLAKGNDRFKNISSSAGDLITASTQLKVAFKNIGDELAIFVSNNYSQFFADIATGLARFIKEANGTTTISDKAAILNEEIQKLQTSINNLTFAKFEREGKTGIAALIQPFKDGAGSATVLDQRLRASTKRVEELRAELKALTTETANPAAGKKTSKADSVDQDKAIDARIKKEQELSVFLNSQRSERLKIEADTALKSKELGDDRLAVLASSAIQLEQLEQQRDQKILESKVKFASDVAAQELAKSAIDQTFAAQKIALSQQTQDAIEKIEKDSAQKRLDTQKAVSNSIRTTISSGITQTVSDIGTRLAKGEGLFDGFGNAVVGIIADMAISIGNTLIVQGLAIEAFITAINSLIPGSGAAAAAAGIGLVLFGSALKASVGKGSSGGQATVTGGGIAASPSSTSEIVQQQELERPEAGTQVSVVIQGNVLDSDESGSRIVDLINQAFDKKGVVINQGVMA